MLNKSYTYLIVLLSIFTVQAQTESWKLTWDANPDSDNVNIYRVYRGTSSLPTAQVGSVNHPQTTYEDEQIEKGVLYYYRLKAVNYSAMESDFSAEVSAAMPEISNFPQQMALPPDTTVYLNLDDYAADPDHSDNLLNWAVSGNSRIQVTINNSTHSAEISTPADWDSEETLKFTCTDPDGFEDAVNLRVYFGNETPGSIIKFSLSADDVNSSSDDGNVASNTIDGNLSTRWSAEGDGEWIRYDLQKLVNISYVKIAFYNGGQRTAYFDLQVSDDDVNWRDILIGAESGGVSTNLETFDFTDITAQYIRYVGHGNSANSWNSISEVEIWGIDEGSPPGNAAPSILSLPHASLSPGGSVEFNVSNWASDPDDNVDDLIWTFSNYYHLTLDFNDQTRILRITSIDDGWNGFEYILARVSDDDGAYDSDTLLIRVTQELSPPVINNFPDITFLEDESTTINLNDYVTDSDSPLENLFWRTNGSSSINTVINHTNKEAEFSSSENWYGSEQFWMVVTDPDQQSDSVRITVDVQSVNDSPVLSDLPALDLSNQLQRSINLNNYVADVDDEAANLDWQYSGNTNVTVNIAQNGTASFSTSDTWYGQETIQITVKDDSDAEDSGFMVIYRQNQQQAPSLSIAGSIQMTEDVPQVVEFSSLVSDPDNAVSELNWSFSETENINLNFNKQILTLTLNPAVDWNGTEKITVRVEDPDNNFDIDTLVVDVEAVNDIPKLKQIPNITLYGSTFHTIDLKDVIVEPDGLDDLTEITLYGSNPGYIGHFLDVQNYELTFFTPADYTGSETYFLRVADAEGGPEPVIFVVNVHRNNIDNNLSLDYFGSQTNVRFAWETLNQTKDYIEYGLDQSYGSRSEIDEIHTTDHEHILQNLEQNATYHFRIVSTDENQKVNYSKDSVFTTGESENEMNVFPIPWRAGDADNPDGIFFTNLEPGYKIMIYNLAGDPVRKDESPGYTYKWDITNKSGRQVSSGLYLYIVKNNKNKKVASGKIIVIR